MQGAKIKDEGSVQKYMPKSEIDEQRSSLHIMTQRHLYKNAVRVEVLLHQYLLAIHDVNTGSSHIAYLTT